MHVFLRSGYQKMMRIQLDILARWRQQCALIVRQTQNASDFTV